MTTNGNIEVPKAFSPDSTHGDSATDWPARRFHPRQRTGWPAVGAAEMGSFSPANFVV